MAYLTATALADYMNKVPDESDTKPQEYADGAMDIVNNYLGYDPESKERTETVKGSNYFQLRLNARHISAITAVTCEGESIPAERFCVSADSKDSNYIEFVDGSVFTAGLRYTVTYTAGWESVPQDIVEVAKQVGSLLWESANGNLAVNSTSFADTGTRVFNNYTPDRFLKNIDSYRIEEIC